MSGHWSAFDPIFFAYLLLFGGAAVGCFVAIPQLRRLHDPDTRRGLYALLLMSGGWAATHVGYFAAPTPQLQYAFYVLGLVVGIGTVGPWLYFCSAYTGRTLHRNRSIRWSAVAVYLVIVTIKLTNPLHHQYFTTETATDPFPHLLVVHGSLHWLAMGLAYSLAFVGFFMLFELFLRVNSETGPLFVLVGLTGLPIAFDVLGVLTPYLINTTYSSIGVAAFAVGVSYFYVDQLRTVQLAGDTGSPIVVLDDRDRIRDFNTEARHLFPDLRNGLGEPLHELLPDVAEALGTGDDVVELNVDGSIRYYNVSSNPLTTDRTRLGETILMNDVTHREQYRRSLERQNERLDQFAGMVSHDLRNPLTVAKGRIELAKTEPEPEHLDTASEALDRMNELIDDILALARQGRTIDATERVELRAIAEDAWRMVDGRNATLESEPASGVAVEADPERLQQLLENLFRNAVEHGGSDVRITVGPLSDGFYVADDGSGIDESDRNEIFGAGYTTSADGTGFGLAIAEEIVDAHGWSIRVPRTDGGARFEIRTGQS